MPLGLILHPSHRCGDGPERLLKFHHGLIAFVLMSRTHRVMEIPSFSLEEFDIIRIRKHRRLRCLKTNAVERLAGCIGPWLVA